ncbi:MAG: dUTP diphosphatase [Halioglobus sp.]|nr:dUTP diphosphatase [Halioglobus sp.]
MQQALVNMLTMQHNMNSRVHPDWLEQEFAWYRAVWIECAELIDHYGYKWWKQHTPDMEQVRLEVIDIWHFGLSALFRDGRDIAQIAAQIERELADFAPAGLGVREATEELAADTLRTRQFCVTRFWELMHAVDLDFDRLYGAYIGKNVLNFFRQDNGYQDGSYVKNWAGREDNEHLIDLVAALDRGAADFAQQVYRSLDARYRELVAR